MTRLSRALVAAALLLAVQPLGAQTYDLVCDPGDTEVRRLDFVGNRTFPSAALERGIATTQSSWFRRHVGFGKAYCLDSLAVRADSLRLRTFYRRHGFLEAKISLQLRPLSPRAVHVRYGIEEGRPTLVDSLGIAGLDSVPDRERIVRALPLRTGGRFDAFAIEATRDTLLDRLHDRGYPIADVLRSYEPSAAPYAQTVDFVVTPGPLSYLGEIKVTVQTLRDSVLDTTHVHIRPDRVRRVLGVRPGQLYRESSLERVKRGLFLTEAFRAVDVSVDSASLVDGKTDSVTIGVTLVEADLRAARTSLGWGNLDCLRAQGSYSNYGFLGRLRRLDLTGRVSKVGVGHPLDVARGFCSAEVREDPLSDTLNYYLSATVSQAALFGLPFVPSATLFSERRSEFQAFIREVPIGIGGALQQGVDGSFPQTYSYQLEFGRTLAQPAFFCAVFNVCEDAAQERLQRQSRSAVLGWSATRNRADNFASPRTGSVIRLDVRHASRIVGSDPDVAFNRGVIDASLYRPAFDGAFIIRFRAGSVFGTQRLTGGPKFIPLQERLYAGGATTVRGFQQNELGPAIYIPQNIDTIPVVGLDSVAYFRATPGRTRETVVPLGGDNLIVANAELRMRSLFLPDLVQFAAFVDAGQVWNRGRPGINFDDVRVTPGVGVRYFSPIGPVRVDVGYNVYDRPAGAAYYNPLQEPPNYSLAGDVRLICVSPNNQLRVRLGDPAGNPPTPPRQIDEGVCPGTYAPAKRAGFLSRLTFHFSIGQAF